jgi:hypothetical protein
LRQADPPSKESYRLCIDQEIEKAAKVDISCTDRQIDKEMVCYEKLKDRFSIDDFYKIRVLILGQWKPAICQAFMRHYVRCVCAGLSLLQILELLRAR